MAFTHYFSNNYTRQFTVYTGRSQSGSRLRQSIAAICGGDSVLFVDDQSVFRLRRWLSIALMDVFVPKVLAILIAKKHAKLVKEQ